MNFKRTTPGMFQMTFKNMPPGADSALRILLDQPVECVEFIKLAMKKEHGIEGVHKSRHIVIVYTIAPLIWTMSPLSGIITSLSTPL